MSDTPRTDAVVYVCVIKGQSDTGSRVEHVQATFARTLERELKDAKEQLKPRNGHTFEDLQKMWENTHIELAKSITELDQWKQCAEGLAETMKIFASGKSWSALHGASCWHTTQELPQQVAEEALASFNQLKK